MRRYCEGMIAGARFVAILIDSGVRVSEWTPQDVATIMVAGVAAGISLLSAGAAWAAIVQLARYKDRAHVSGNVNGGGGGWTAPRMEVRFRNHGPVPAEELELEIKGPAERRWRQIYDNVPKQLEAHQTIVFWAGLGSISDPISIWVDRPSKVAIFTDAEPVRGVWRWRLSWAAVPNPRKHKHRTLRHRVTERRIRNREYYAMG